MPRRSTKKILVVDDESSIRIIIKRLVEKYGYSATVCASSPEAFAAARNTPPALIISDFNLPGQMDGIDLCSRIRSSTKKDIPVIIISGQINCAVKSKDRGFKFLGKPLKKKDLILLVEDCLRSNGQVSKVA